MIKHDITKIKQFSGGITESSTGPPAVPPANHAFGLYLYSSKCFRAVPID